MKCKISSNARMLLSCGVLIAFALIAGASTDEIGVFLVIGVVAVVIVGIVAIVNEQMKKSARKSMEDSMSSDFQITKKSLMENDFALYFDQSREKIRFVKIGTSDCESKDFEDVVLGNVHIASSTGMAIGTGDKFYIAENLKDESLVLAKDLFFNKIEDFSISNYVLPARSFFAVDDKRQKMIVIADFKQYTIVDYEDVIRVEIIEDGSAISSKSAMRTLGGAVVGNVVACGAGMIVGGLSGSSKSSKEVREIKVKLLLRDIKKPELVITIYEGCLKTKNDSDRDTYNKLMKSATQIKDIVSVVIDNMDKKASANTKQSDTTSVADEISKLLKLKEQGILTEEEFNAQKAKLLK